MRKLYDVCFMHKKIRFDGEQYIRFTAFNLLSLIRRGVTLQFSQPKLHPFDELTDEALLLKYRGAVQDVTNPREVAELTGRIKKRRLEIPYV